VRAELLVHAPPEPEPDVFQGGRWSGAVFLLPLKK
jgi:hypothetical protein